MFSAITTILLIVTLCCLNLAQASSRHNTTCLIVFGDSSVDPGNNNKLDTQIKCNFLPYSEDFFNGRPTGRFCNGRLTTDFIAEAFGYTNYTRAYLDPEITKNDLLHAVSFASAGTGYDELTANISNVLSLPKQLEYFNHYKIQLKALVGAQESEKIIGNALLLLSIGTNDFILNYYDNPTRPRQYNIEQYQNFLISHMQTTIKAMQTMGVRKLVVVGVPPIGCLPLVRTRRNDTACDREMNIMAVAFNLKIQRALLPLEGPSIRIVYLDIYSILLNAIQHPMRYGFTEPLKGCCGSGTYEFGFQCKGKKTCDDRTKYIFWDAAHLTEKMYKIIADLALPFLFLVVCFEERNSRVFLFTFAFVIFFIFSLLESVIQSERILSTRRYIMQTHS